MGWGSGSEIMEEIMMTLPDLIKDTETRKNIYKTLISAFEDHDWDTQDEVRDIDKAYDKALNELHSEWR
jgi:hypothetical protein